MEFQVKLKIQVSHLHRLASQQTPSSALSALLGRMLPLKICLSFQISQLIFLSHGVELVPYAFHLLMLFQLHLLQLELMHLQLRASHQQQSFPHSLESSGEKKVCKQQACCLHAVVKTSRLYNLRLLLSPLDCYSSEDVGQGTPTKAFSFIEGDMFDLRSPYLEMGVRPPSCLLTLKVDDEAILVENGCMYF